MKIFSAFILLLAIACSSIFGLMNGDNESFIQGKWQISSESIPENSNVKPGFVEWEFESGKFSQSGYSPLLQQGRYVILEDRNNILKLKLIKNKGALGKKSAQLEIVVDKKNMLLEIGGKKGFSKLEKKSV